MRAPRLKRLILERHGCFGPCPIYRVEVDEDGFVEWEGHRYVKEEGRRSWRIPRADVAILERQLERAGFRWRREASLLIALDLPTCAVTAEYADGTTKRLESALYIETAPNEGYRRDERIDLVLGTAPYVGPRPGHRGVG